MDSCKKPRRFLKNTTRTIYPICIALGIIEISLVAKGLNNHFGGELVASSLNYVAGIGALTVFLGIFGLIGLAKFHPRYLATISAFLLIICIILSAGVAAYLRLVLTRRQRDVSEAIWTNMKLYGRPLHENEDRNFDEIQKRRKCCGSTSPISWNQTDFAKLPMSCCRKPSHCLAWQNETAEVAYGYLIEFNVTSFFNRGCIEALVKPHRRPVEIITACLISNCVFLCVVLAISATYQACIERRP